MIIICAGASQQEIYNDIESLYFCLSLNIEQRLNDSYADVSLVEKLPKSIT